ncbi:membrane protein [Streptococcus salivarius]|uniref:membrane protein n=1 Tax=Streptococcus salivarius TaxID=1304 RepID=UPI0005F35A41|nr:membrane protein [Streptococcus salivarius]KJU92047.1 competence-induced protein Ccs4 [Streptococcus salivarius]
MSPYNEDNTLDSSGYQGYHRSHHRSHTQDNQSEKIEVTIQGHTEESNASQIEKITKISLPWKHKGHILILSLILSIFSISVPCFTDFANNIQSQNLYIAKMFANGSLPYSDFFATGGFFYYLLVSLAFRLGSTLWLIPIQFLTYYLSGSYLYKTVMHMTNKKEIATLISIIFYVTNGTLGFGGLYPIQFAMPFVLGAIFFLTRYFAGHSRDEAFILYGFAGTAGALFEARTLIFWILSLVTIFVYNLVNKHFARGFYQVLCIIFGNILVLYLCLYFILNLQITSDYINQVLVYNFTQLAVEKNDFLLTLAYQSFAVIGSGLLIGALTTSNHLLGDAKDKSIKWVLLLSFIFTVVYSLFSQSFGLYSILNIVPYGLVLTALSLDDAIKKRAERTSHRRRNGNQIHTLKVFGIFLSRNYFLPIAVFAFAFAMPIIMFLFNLGNNTERSTVANYLAKNTKKDETIYVYDSSAKIYLESGRKAASQFVLPELNTAKSSHQKALSDTIIQDSAQYIVVQQDTQLPSDVKSTLSKNYKKAPVKGVERYTVYVLK